MGRTDTPLSALAGAGAGSHPADYTVNVHVSSSSVDLAGHQVLDVVIDAKKYELRSELSIGHLLALGDYKAKLVKNDHQTAYDSSTSFSSPTKPGRTWWSVKRNDITPDYTVDRWWMSAHGILQQLALSEP